MIMVTSWTLIRDVDDGVVWALLGGLFLDLMSLAPFGTHIFALTIVVAIAGLSSAILPNYRGLLAVAVIPLASILYHLSANLILVIFGAPGEWPATVALIVIPAALIDAVVGLPIFWVMNLADDRFSSEAASF